MDATLRQDLRRFAQSIARWQRAGERAAKSEDPDLAKTYRKDVEDLRSILAAVREGDLAHAARLSDLVDTLVRDQIPPRLFNAIYNAAK